MKRLQWIIASVFLLVNLSVYAQNQSKEPAQTETAAQGRTRSQSQTNNAQENTGQEIGSSSEGDRYRGPGTADTPGAAEAAAQANNNDNNAGDSAQVSNEPPVPQTTSSQSGSPAVLAGERGRERDGTNTVQRASMNMAGSPAKNINLNDRRTVDVDSELEDRQDYSQEKQVSAQNQNGNSSTGNTGESNQINNDTRRENNARSDQNLSSKEKNTSHSKNETESKANTSKKRNAKKQRGN